MNAISEESAIFSLIKSCVHKLHLLQLHAHLLRSSGFFNPTICLSLLSAFAIYPLQDLSYSRRIFSTIAHPNVSLYNLMIRAHSKGSDSAVNGLKFYRELLGSGISANSFSASFAVKCCHRIESLFDGIQIHARIWRHGYLGDGLLLTTLMDFYSCLGKCSDVYKVFDEMRHRDVVAWNVLLSCYIRNGRTLDALNSFDAMRNCYQLNPDNVTCLLVLQACAKLNALEFGRKVHEYAVEQNMIHAKNLCNSLIFMYSRCGSIEEAFSVFHQMINKDVVSWSAMISGLASNGYASDAIEAFKEMQRNGFSPGEQTFTGVLSACSHSGLVDEGRRIFNSMSRDFHLTPNVHHYGCMVDLLGRAGLLEEAYNLIASMSVKPDAMIWRTLLGACRIHRHVTLGERVIEHLVEVKAHEAGDYILLLNIYSSAGDSEKVSEVRKMMKDAGIRTKPAVSTIELHDQIHEFSADDVVHPRRKEVYVMLDEINQQLGLAGYVPEMRTEEQYHSEKLAIAFGVVATPPNATIRVAKDLRTCFDCHNFSKYLSAVYNRKVIVRDRNRFHTFWQGHCSCNDYW